MATLKMRKLLSLTRPTALFDSRIAQKSLSRRGRTKMDVAAESLGWLAAVVFAIDTIPQIVKTLYTRSAKDVSRYAFLLRALGNGAQCVYFVMGEGLDVEKTLPALIGSAWSGSACLLVVALCYVYSPRASPSRPWLESARAGPTRLSQTVADAERRRRLGGRRQERR